MCGGIERKTWGQFEAVEERLESLQIRNFLEIQFGNVPK
jgi:hypothetical protein